MFYRHYTTAFKITVWYNNSKALQPTFHFAGPIIGNSPFMTDTEPTPKSASPKGKTQNAREEILQHAKLLFRQKGFTAVSMNDLVASVGLTKPTIYYHFSDKETLFTEVVIEMMRHGNELFSAGIKRSKTLHEKLHKLSEGYFRFSPTSLSTMVRDSIENLSDAHLKRVMEAHRFYLVGPIIEIFAQAMKDGEIKENDPEQLALFFISWIDAITVLKTGYEGRTFDARNVSLKMVDIYLAGISKS